MCLLFSSYKAACKRLINASARASPLLLFMGLLLLLVNACSGDTISHFFYNDQQNVEVSQDMYTVSGRPLISIQSDAATIHIHSGSAQQVIIKGTKHTAHGDTIEANYSQQGNTITITSYINRAETRKEASNLTYSSETTFLELDITTPETSDTNIQDTAGSVTLENLSGQQIVKSEGGSIILNQTTLTRASWIETIAGTVTFDGDVAPQSNITMKTTAGTIEATLSKDDLVDVSVDSMLGQVQNDFDSSSTSPTQSTLHIENTTGSVLVHQRTN
ncbi:hypothetical protein KSC_085990 [Ktedonobacter sp. SOSP1-52]|uniref:hypothetical protein n=1 Tax=Ktedonobacter sp. SOSP1-52 TaxID=2778366 RepID=UPI00191591DC|nr:hypothetical protein [Ktedonobacter sp. SOSP1-52]GHO69707.1 hypothetical protein KSC_085990 [Ktedonobacter sp. SOSP1-52]